MPPHIDPPPPFNLYTMPKIPSYSHLGGGGGVAKAIPILRNGGWGCGHCEGGWVVFFKTVHTLYTPWATSLQTPWATTL